MSKLTCKKDLGLFRIYLPFCPRLRARSLRTQGASIKWSTDLWNITIIEMSIVGTFFSQAISSLPCHHAACQRSASDNDPGMASPGPDRLVPLRFSKKYRNSLVNIPSICALVAHWCDRGRSMHASTIYRTNCAVYLSSPEFAFINVIYNTGYFPDIIFALSSLHSLVVMDATERQQLWVIHLYIISWSRLYVYDLPGTRTRTSSLWQTVQEFFLSLSSER